VFDSGKGKANMSLLGLLLPFAILWPFLSFPQSAPDAGSKETVIVIPHTHGKARFSRPARSTGYRPADILKALNC
jgi:hypothetical protein